MGVATGCGFKEIYRFPHTTYPYSSCIWTFLQQHPYFFVQFVNVFTFFYNYIEGLISVRTLSRACRATGTRRARGRRATGATGGRRARDRHATGARQADDRRRRATGGRRARSKRAAGARRTGGGRECPSRPP